MHDSRGAALQVGDRVLIEAQVTRLNDGGDENYCCVDVTVVTPDQPNKDKVMSPPSFGALSTRMLTKVGVAVCVLLALAAPLFADDGVMQQIKANTLAIDQLQKDMNATMAALSKLSGDMGNVQQDVAAMRADIASIKKTLAEGGTSGSTQKVWQPDVTDVWGRVITPGRFVPVGTPIVQSPPPMAPPIAMTTSTPMMSMGYSSMSSGGCANGSCGSGMGRGLIGRIFGRH